MDGTPYTKIIIHNLRVDMFIGVHEFEKEKKQPVIINVEVFTDAPDDWQADDISNALDYQLIVTAIEGMTKGAHIDLVETLAEKIAATSLTIDKAHAATVRVEKPEIYGHMDAIGVEIHRKK